MEEIQTILQESPKSAWSALLPQIICWSFRRFCVDRISSYDVSSQDLSGQWDDTFDLVTSYAPKPLQKYVEQWFTPEHVEQMNKLTELDLALRKIVETLDASVLQNDNDEEVKIADFLDEGLSNSIEAWLAPHYSHFSIFPTIDESDDDIDETKLNAILYLLKAKKADKQERKGMKKTHRRVRFADTTPIQRELIRRKTRKHKQIVGNVPVPLPTKTPGDDTRGTEGKDNGSVSEERKGDETSHDA